MPFTGPREDQDAIRELYGMYSDCSAMADGDAFTRCFAADGQWNSHVFTRQGTAELREQWDQLWLAFDKVGFLAEIGSIEVQGERASARCVAREIIKLKDGGVYKMIGQYRDELVKKDGQWVFARRDYSPIAEELPS